MKVQRGDVVLVQLPFASGQGAKIRPVLVIQSDHNNARLRNTLIAAITSNTSRAAFEATQYLIDVQTPEGAASGLRFDSAVICEYLATIEQDRILKCLGSLPPPAMQQIDECLKAALGIS
ncbi:type II toxin-antitoxin system PemK/MazF family toxin [bacterium]|nr:type II toxin-antitoxin system PemK/MazF family toxin [bacterium]